MKTLVIILSETRAHELTFDNFKKNVLDELDADLCVCIGIKPEYDYENPFYKTAKYKFVYNEPDDYGDAYEEAYKELSPLNREENPLHWREFLKIKDQFLGGIKGENQHPGSAGILIFFRWFLLKKLMEKDLLRKYDRFIVTRSDYMYQLPHPPLEILDEKSIWVPDEEHYGGYTDRHAILTRDNITSYLNILNNFVLKSNDYYNKLKDHEWNLERIIKFNLEEEKQNVREFPYVMYAVRSKETGTRWSEGDYSKDLGYYIKYKTEFDASSKYKKEFEESGLSLSDFYKKSIAIEGFQVKSGSSSCHFSILLVLFITGIILINSYNLKEFMLPFVSFFVLILPFNI
jgi:hypothetical protein